MCYRGGYRTQNYCVENANGCIRLHDTRPSLCCPFFFFFLFLNCSDVCKLWHRWKEQEDQMFVSAVWARRHVNICDMKWAVSVVRPWKRDSWAALYFYFTFFFPCNFEHFMDTLSIWSVPCLLLYCSVSRQQFPCRVYCLWLLLGAQPRGSLWSYTCHGSVINLLMIFHQWVIPKSSEPFVKPVCNKRKA